MMHLEDAKNLKQTVGDWPVWNISACVEQTVIRQK